MLTCIFLSSLPLYPGAAFGMLFRCDRLVETPHLGLAGHGHLKPPVKITRVERSCGAHHITPTDLTDKVLCISPVCTVRWLARKSTCTSAFLTSCLPCHTLYTYIHIL